MPTIKTYKRTDRLAGLVQIEVATPFDFILVMHSCALPDFEVEKTPEKWALKLRNRLQPQTLEIIDQLSYLFPFSLALRIPKPRTIESFLAMLESLPAESFLDELISEFNMDEAQLAIADKMWLGTALTPAELELMVAQLEHKELVEHFIRVLPHWQDQAVIKSRFIAAFHNLYDVYFRREVERIEPVLENSAAEVRALLASKILPTMQLIEGITKGFTLSEDAPYTGIILAPSFYVAPYVSFETLRDNTLLLLYPARPDGMAIDSDSVDDAHLLRQLKALSDKTRLEILRLLAKHPYYNQELADALKLTQPTISHHMGELRVSGLVRAELHNNAKQYSLYPNFADILADDLKNFLGLNLIDVKDNRPR